MVLGLRGERFLKSDNVRLGKLVGPGGGGERGLGGPGRPDKRAALPKLGLSMPQQDIPEGLMHVFRHHFRLELGAEDRTPRSLIYSRLLGPFSARSRPPLLAPTHLHSCSINMHVPQRQCSLETRG